MIVSLLWLTLCTAVFVVFLLPLMYSQQERHRAQQISEHLEIMRVLTSVRDSQRALERPQVLPFAPREAPNPSVRFLRLGIKYPYPPPGDDHAPQTKH